MKVCKNGSHHYDNHYRECPVCRQNRKKKWQEDNPEKYAERKIKYNEKYYNSSEYHKKNSERYIWRSMIYRCTNPNTVQWMDYGGRGITVCERWFTYENFIADMGPRPSSDYTLDRENNELGYSKENCKWSTWVEQARNRRNNVMVDGKCLSQIAEETGVTLNRRFKKTGSIEAPNLIMHDGKSMNLLQWSKELGISQGMLYYRLSKGWTFERAIAEPKYKHKSKL